MAKNSPDTEVKQTKQPTGGIALNAWNRWFAALYVAQGLIVALLSSPQLYPVQTNYLTDDFITSEITGNPLLGRAVAHVFEVNLLNLVVASFLMAAIFHAIIATLYRRQYEAELRQRLNIFRWIDCAITGAILVTAVGLVSGIADLATLIALFGATVITALSGLAMELYNNGQEQPIWLAFVIGALAALIPLAIFAGHIWATVVYGSASIPGFMYGLYATVAIFGIGFAANMYLQFTQKGMWKNYAHVERMYLLLSVGAKTALVWQIYAGVLRP